MKAKLPSAFIPIVRARVFISNTTDILTKQSIADGFDISRFTLRRYVSDEAREQSRLSVKYNPDRERKSLHCWHCAELIATHQKCASCHILLHDDKPIGHSTNGITCDNRYCIATFLRRSILILTHQPQAVWQN